jgi:hypothetical protein
MNTTNTTKFFVTAAEAYPVWEFTNIPEHGDEVQLDDKLVKKYLRAQKAYGKAWDALTTALKGQHHAAR